MRHRGRHLPHRRHHPHPHPVRGVQRALHLRALQGGTGRRRPDQTPHVVHAGAAGCAEGRR